MADTVPDEDFLLAVLNSTRVVYGVPTDELADTAAATPNTSSAISKASNSAPTAASSISSARLGQHQTPCTRSMCAAVRNVFYCPPMIFWSSTSAAANIKTIWSCSRTAILCSAAVMIGIGFMIPPAKRNSDRPAISTIEKT